MHFAGQVVWITGASSGIGAALARAYARAGARVVLSARRADALAAVQASLPPVAAGAHLILPLDLAMPDRFPEAVAHVLATCGQVDVLVNNGGLGQRGLAAGTPLAVDRAIMETNYFGTIGLTKAVLPAMQARRQGHIVVISSVVGHVATPRRSAYSASKHALHGFFDALRAEVHPEGIHVTMVCPGYVRTEISLHALDSTGAKHGRMDASQSRGMDPERFAAKTLLRLRRRPAEIVIGGIETKAIWLKRFAPGLLGWLLRRLRFS